MRQRAGLTARLLSAATAALLIAGLAGVAPASGQTASADPRTTPPSERKVRPPVVSARADRVGVHVGWKHTPQNVARVDVLRTSGDKTVNLTPAGVTGNRFLDRTAAANTTYTYEVKVRELAEAPAKTSGSKQRAFLTTASAGQSFGTAEVTTAAAKTVGKSARASAAKARAAGLRDEAKSRVRRVAPTATAPAPSGKVTIASHTGDCLIAGGSLPAGTTTWSPATCPNGYQVAEDVVVPVGSTLSILPGTFVYFNTTAADPGNADGVAAKVDLLVKGGTLIADGTPTSQITFTSIQTSSQDTAGNAAPGDWGVFLGDAGSMLTLDNIRVSYGTGLAFNEIAPALTSSVIQNNSGATGALPFRSAAGGTGSSLEWFDPPAGSTVNINGVVLGASSANYGAAVYSFDPDTNGVTININNSSFTGNYAFWAEDDSDDVPARITANVTNSQFHGLSSAALWLGSYESETDEGADPSASATVNGIISNVTVDTPTGSGDGIYTEASSDEGDGTNTIAFVNTQVHTDDDAVENYAYASNVSGDGVATSTHTVTGGIYRSNTDDGWYDEAQAYGAGSAHSQPAFTDTRIEGVNEEGVDIYTYSEDGDSTADPTFLRVTIQAYDSAVYTYAETYGDTAEGADGGDAVSSPRLTDTVARSSDEYAIQSYAYVYDRGSATASPTFLRSKLDNSYGGIYVYAETTSDQATDAATASPVLTSTQVASNDYEALYAEAYSYDEGTAHASPVVTNSSLYADDDYGIYTYAETDRAGAALAQVGASALPVPVNNSSGSANTFPVVDNSQVTSYYEAVYAESRSYNSGAGDARSVPTVRNGSDVKSKYYEGVYSDAYSQGSSSAIAAPEVIQSKVHSGDDYGVYAYADHGAGGTGDSTAGGSITDSTITSYYDAAYYEAYAYDGDALAAADPTITDSFLRSQYYSGVYAYAENDGGSAVSRPTVLRGRIEAPDSYSVEAETYGWGAEGDTLLVDPTITGVTLTSYYGVYLDAEDYYYSPGGSHDAMPVAAGTITDSVIDSSDDFGIEVYAYAYDSTAGSRIDTEVINTDVHSYDGIYLYTLSYGCYEYDGVDSSECANADPAQYDTGLAVNSFNMENSTPHMVESWWDYGIEADTYAYQGADGGRSEFDVRGVTFRTQYDGIYEYVWSEDGTATAESNIVNNDISTYGNSNGGGVYLYSSSNSGSAAMNTTVAGNNIHDVDDDGVYVYVGGAAEDLNVVVAGNTITGIRDSGIDIQTGSGDTDDTAHVVGNTVDRTESAGIDVYRAIPDIRSNTVTRSGWGTASTGDYDHSGIWVEDVPSMIALSLDDAPSGLVRCNVVTGHQIGISYVGNTEDPATNENSFKSRDNKTNGALNLKTTAGATNAEGNWWGVTGADIDDTISGSDVDRTPARDETACRGGYTLDGYGGVHGYGPGTATPTSGPYWAGWDIARAIAVDPDGASGKVLDAYGGIHPFGSADADGQTPSSVTYFGFDVARDIAVRNADANSGYTLDAWGGVHPWGGAPDVTVSYYAPGTDTAKRLVLRPDGSSGYVVTGDGQLHPFGPAGSFIPDATSGPSFGMDIARDVIVNHDGNSGYVLDGYGGLTPFGTAFGSAPAVTSGPYWPGWDIVNAATWFDDTGRFEMDAYGGVHVSKSDSLPLSAPTASAYWSGWDIARDMEGAR